MLRNAPARLWPRGIVAPNRRQRLTDVLGAGERVLWTGAPDTMATLRTQRALWWVGVPWTCAAIALSAYGLIPWNLDFFAIVLGGVFLATPLLITFQAGGTVYAITDRRAILRHNALGQHQVVSIDFAEMDESFEILPTGPNTGHLYFASGQSTRLAYADYDGKLAFRELRDPEAVRDLLERIRAHAR